MRSGISHLCKLIDRASRVVMSEAPQSFTPKFANRQLEGVVAWNRQKPATLPSGAVATKEMRAPITFEPSQPRSIPPSHVQLLDPNLPLE